MSVDSSQRPQPRKQADNGDRPSRIESEPLMPIQPAGPQQIGGQVQPASASTGSLLSVPHPKTFIDRLPVVGFVWFLYRTYSRRNGPLLSAGIAYYALFSMGPLLLLTLQIAGRLFQTGLQDAATKLTEDLERYLGHDVAAVLTAAITRVKGPSGYTFAIVGIGILLYGATRLFVRLQASFNIMWDVKVVSRAFSFRRLISRLLVFGMILVPTVLLIVGLVLGTAISWLTNLLGDSGVLLQVAQTLIPFVISWLALLAIYVVLPDVHLSWRDCWFTTMLIAIAWAVATRVFGTYLGWTGSTRYAGAIGALVGIIFWTDILAIIALVGVRFNRAMYVWRGKVIRPYAYAALITDLPDADLYSGRPGPEQSAGRQGAPARDDAAMSATGLPREHGIESALGEGDRDDQPAASPGEARNSADTSTDTES